MPPLEEITENLPPLEDLAESEQYPAIEHFREEEYLRSQCHLCEGTHFFIRFGTLATLHKSQVNNCSDNTPPVYRYCLEYRGSPTLTWMAL